MPLRRPAKLTLTAASVVALLTAGLQAWSQFAAWKAAQTRAGNESAFEREVTMCEARGGQWWKGDCFWPPPPPVRGRDPK